MLKQARMSAVLVLAGATIANATTIIPPENLAELARDSQAVVIAEARDSVAVGTEILSTETEFVVRASIDGTLRVGESLVVQTLGGERPDLVTIAPGSPRFERGSRYFLCLVQRDARTWLPRMAGYGVLRETIDETGRPILAPLEDTALSASRRPDGRAVEPVTRYDRDALVEHLGAVLHDAESWSRELVQTSEGVRRMGLPAGCAQFSVAAGDRSYFLRWKAFDDGGSLAIRAENDNDSQTDGIARLREALGVWNAIPGSTVNLTYGGAVNVVPDCGNPDAETPNGAARDTVVFNDPCSDIPDLTPTGGVLARGGVVVRRPDGTAGITRYPPDECDFWMDVIAGFVLVNNGIIGPNGISTAVQYRRMLAHEIGHALGFDHVGDASALMYADCCNPVNATDTRCAQHVYAITSPDIEASPASVAFGNVAVDQQVSRTVTISNAGLAQLDVTSFALAGGTSSEFSIAAPASASVHPCSGTRQFDIEIRYRPRDRGADAGSIVIRSNDPASPSFSIPVSGTGTAGQIVTIPNSLDFGQVGVGGQRADRLEIRNVGNAPLRLASLSLLGSHRADYEIVAGGAAGSIPIGGQRGVDLRFSPTASGARNASLRITSDDPDSSDVRVPLSGFGADADIEVTPSTLDLGVIMQGQSSTAVITIRNRGLADLNVSAADLVADPADVFSVDWAGATVLGRNQLLDVPVTYRPSSEGLHVGTVRIASSDPNTPEVDVRLRGQGEPLPGGERVPGDCNSDGALDLSDGICLLGFLFQGEPARLPCGDGTDSDAANRVLLDWNNDRTLDLSDAVSVISFLFLGTAEHHLGTACQRIPDCEPGCPR